MVNAKWIERKLIIGLVGGPTTKKKYWNIYCRYRYQLSKFKRLHPDEYAELLNESTVFYSKIEDKISKS